MLKLLILQQSSLLDEELVVASAEKTGRVITVEEHSIIGGLGEAVCACLSKNARLLLRESV